MSSKKNFLLITDSSHPEVFAIANQLFMRKIQFTLVSSFVFTKKESSILIQFPFLPDLFSQQISRRSIDLDPDLSKLIRTVPLTDLVAKLLNRLPNVFRGRWWILLISRIDQRMHQAYSRRASEIMRKTRFSHVVYQSSLKIENKDDSVIPIEIAYHGNLSQEIFWKNIASNDYPEWGETWKISDVNYSFPQDPNEHLASSKRIVYASSFNVSFSENSIQPICSPLGAIKTVEFIPNMKSENTSLIHHGQLGLRKGIPIILEVAKRVPVKFTLCGSGSAEVISKIKDAKRKNIELLLTPSDGEIRRRLSSAQAFILPSYYEGFGIAILEAMSYGCIPIVSRNTCGPDILNGTDLERFLIPPGNVSALEGAIQNLIEMEKSEKIYLGEIAATISKSYTLSDYADRILDSLLQ